VKLPPGFSCSKFNTLKWLLFSFVD
jgi:hypothetical protein